MESADKLEGLERLAERLGVRVRYEEGDFKGGLCWVNGERMIIVQKKATLEQKIANLASGFGRLDVGNVYVVPELRKLIEQDREDSDGFETDGG